MATSYWRGCAPPCNAILATDSLNAMRRLKARHSLALGELQLLQDAQSHLGAHPSIRLTLLFAPSHFGVVLSEAVDAALVSHANDLAANPFWPPSTLPPLPRCLSQCQGVTWGTLEEDEARAFNALRSLSLTKAGSEASESATLMLRLGASRSRVKKWLAAFGGRRPLQIILLRITTYSLSRTNGAANACPHCPSLLTPECILRIRQVFSPHHRLSPHVDESTDCLAGYREIPSALPDFMHEASSELIRLRLLLSLTTLASTSPLTRGPERLNSSPPAVRQGALL